MQLHSEQFSQILGTIPVAKPILVVTMESYFVQREIIVHILCFNGCPSSTACLLLSVGHHMSISLLILRDVN